MKNFDYARGHEYNILKDLNNWEDLDEMKDLFCSEVNIFCYYDDQIDEFVYEDVYGNAFHGKEKEVSDETKILDDMENRRYRIFNDKMKDLVEKIK